MSYVGTLVVSYLSQIAYDQLSTPATLPLFNNFVSGTLIPKAEGIIDAYVGRREGTLRHFNPHGPGTMTLDGIGKSVLFLPPKYAPLYGLVSGTIDGVAIPTIGDVKWYPQYVKYDNNSFAEGNKNVTLIGTYGYASVPHDIQLITAQICSNILLDMVRRNVAPDVFMGLMQSGSESGDSAFQTLFAMPTVFTNEHKKLLDEYRIYWTDIG